MNIKRILFGEKTPDRDDPEYQKLREESEAAGRKFAELLHLGAVVAAVQRFADRHSKIFLCIIFAFVLFCLTVHLYRLNHALNHRPTRSSAVERQEQELHFKRHHGPAGSRKGNDNIIKEIYYYDETL
jgi:hypothetical protein